MEVEICFRFKTYFGLEISRESQMKKTQLVIQKIFGHRICQALRLSTEDAIIKKINKKTELAPKFMKCMNHALSTH